MKQYKISDGVITGRENNDDLFIRKVTFPVDHFEDSFHYHKNSFEFYVVLEGELTFQAEAGDQLTVSQGTVVYFKNAEKHRITKVYKKAEVLLLKKIESEKIVD